VNIIVLLKKMHEMGTLSSGQLSVLTDVHLNKRYSVHWELRTAIYIGVLLVATGMALTIRQYFAQLGDIAIIGSLTTGVLAAFTYCFLKGKPYSNEAVESPGIMFDYVLLFGCTCYATDIGYIETQFSVLGNLWIHYLLVSTGLFFFLAYRFDNRLVLSMALSTLAAWFGFQLSEVFISFHKYYRESAITYGFVSLALGITLYRLVVKKHFFDIYLNFAIHFLMVALLSGLIEYKLASWYFPAMTISTIALVIYSLRSRRFLYMLYAILYSFAGMSALAFDFIKGTAGLYLYGIFSSLAVILLIFILSRRYKEVT